MVNLWESASSGWVACVCAHLVIGGFCVCRLFALLYSPWTFGVYLVDILACPVQQPTPLCFPYSQDSRLRLAVTTAGVADANDFVGGDGADEGAPGVP